MRALGIPLQPSHWLVVEHPDGEREEIAHADWRARLARNFARPSTGRWEPLSFERVRMVPDPNVYVMRDYRGNQTIVGHPDTLRRLDAFLPPT